MIRFRYFGDEEVARSFMHFAKGQMFILKKLMGFQSLVTDMRRYRNPANGLEITCSIVSGLESIDIYYPPTIIVPVVEEVEEELEYTYAPYLILAVGSYVGSGGAYNLGDFVGVYFSVWDVENEVVVVPPGGDPDEYFVGGETDGDADSSTFFKALCFEGNPNSVINLAQTNAEKVTASGIDCTLTIPSGFNVNESCSDSSLNAFGDAANCSMKYKKESSFGEYTLTRQETFSTSVGYYRMLAPLELTVYGSGTETHSIALPGQSLLLGDDGQYKVKVDYVLDSYYDYASNTYSVSITKGVEIESPMGELFESEPLDSNVCTQELYTGHYKDVYETSSVCKAIGISSPNLEDDARVAFYFAQYNTYEGDIQDDFYCYDYENLIKNGFDYAPNIITIGDRKYDIIAGVDRNSASEGTSIVKSAGLTQAFKDLIDYYHAHTLLGGVPLESNYVNTRLDIDATLISWKVEV